mgnify:CR=1 FL=1
MLFRSLNKLGFSVTAMTGKADQADYLKAIGASDVIGRDGLSEENKRPMLGMDWAHGVDTVGGEILANIIKSLKYGGSVAICGLVASPVFSAAVFPFILRGVNVLGIDSVELPVDHKRKTWERLATDWQLAELDTMAHEVRLDGLGTVLDQIFAGQATGRNLVVHD